jgi:hypothetical protein
MDPALEFLRSYLEDEFSSTPGARVQVLLPSTTRRSIDLHQDYDAAAHDLHSRRGVRVTLGSRDYYFPADWVQEMPLVYRQVAEMRKFLGV